MNSYIIHSTLNVNFEFNNNNKQQKHQHLIVSPETNEKNKSLNIFNNNIQTNGNSTKLDSSLQSQQFLSAPRPLRRCRSSSPSTNPTLYRTINGNLQILNFEQQILIRKSWSRIQKSTFGNTIFEKMIEKCSSIERLFNPLDPLAITRHERYFTELIQWAVDGMAEPDKLLSSWLEIVGREHNQFKIKRLHWDYMGEALTESICQSTTIIGKQRRETIHAWRLLLSFLADRLGGSSSSSPINLIQEGGNGFNRIHLLQLVADGPRQYQTEEKDLKII